MSKVIENTNEVLNDLVRINNDRVEGYTKAQKESEENTPDLISTFQTMVRQSEDCINDLKHLIMTTGGTVAEGSTIMGKIYRAWMDLRITFSADDKRNILASCEFGEDAAQKAYKTALEEADLTDDARMLISDQKSLLRNSHDLIKRWRDQQKELANQ